MEPTAFPDDVKCHQHNFEFQGFQPTIVESLHSTTIDSVKRIGWLNEYGSIIPAGHKNYERNI